VCLHVCQEFLVQNCSLASERSLSVSGAGGGGGRAPPPTADPALRHNREVNHCGYLYTLNVSHNVNANKPGFTQTVGHFVCSKERIIYFASADAEVPCVLCLQCFDAVGWVAGRASGL